GRHGLRFLASAPIMRDGEQVGGKGYTNRGNSDFTGVSAQTSRSGGGATSAKGSDPAESGSASANGAGTTTTDGTARDGGVIAVAPPSTGPTSGPTPAPVAARAAEQVVSPTEDEARF